MDHEVLGKFFSMCLTILFFVMIVYFIYNFDFDSSSIKVPFSVSS